MAIPFRVLHRLILKIILGTRDDNEATEKRGFSAFQRTLSGLLVLALLSGLIKEYDWLSKIRCFEFTVLFELAPIQRQSYSVEQNLTVRIQQTLILEHSSGVEGLRFGLKTKGVHLR